MILDGCRLDKEEFCPIPQDVGPEDHFDYFRMKEMFILWFTLLLSKVFTGFLFKTLEKMWCFKELMKNFYIFESILYCLFVLLWSYITYIQNEQVICSFPRWCTEGENNTLVTENYYYKMDKCPIEKSWLTYLYEETRPKNFNYYCENTEYGCCSLISNRCADSLNTENSFSLYLEIESRNISHWHLNIMKTDETGKNCPTIEEIIYTVSKNSQTNYYEIYTTFYVVHTIFIFIVFALGQGFYDERYCKEHKEHKDHKEYKEHTDETNPLKMSV